VAGEQGRLTTTLIAPRTRAAGTAVGAFRLESCLGGGHDTEVWRANGDGIIVALKLLRAGSDALTRARLAREAAVLASIDHPAIGRALDAGEEDGEPFLAFTLYDAGTLAARIDRGRLTVREAAAVFAPIADALAYVHAAGVVHRDVKPANVLCAANGPVLIDFSIASVTGSTYDGWIEGAPAVSGTEGYRAPEAGVDGRPPGPALDVYGLGVSLIEAVTGSRRTDVDDATVATLGPLAPIVASCVAPLPEARPTAAAVATELSEIAGDGRPPVEPAPSGSALMPPSVAVTERIAARSDELARLDASVADGVAADELRAVLIAAPAGAGKTWLVQHAAARVAATSRARVLTARCSAAAGDPSVLRAWLRPFLDRARDTGRDPLDLLADTAGRAAGAQVGRMLGLSHGSVGASGDADAGAVADALVLLLASLGTVVCIVEDLHHASLELLDLLARLAHRGGAPGAIWCTTRPSMLDADDLDFETLALQPLDDGAIAAVVADAIGDATGRVVAQVVSVAGGNPLHAREAALAAQRGTAGGALGSLPELISDRLESFDDATRHGLEIAAACGETFWPEAVGGALLAATPMLYQAGVAQVRMTSSIAGSTEASWSHPLLQEVAYERLAAPRRRVLHAELSEQLDASGALAEVVARQAGTAFRLGNTRSASLAGRAGAAAARDALDRFALSSAGSWIDLVRDSGHEPVNGVADVLDAELRVARGEFEPAARLVRPLTTRDDDIGAQALVLATEATAGAGDLRAAERFGEQARARLGDDPQLAASFGGVLARRGRLEDALTLLDAAIERARAAGEEAFAARLAAEAAGVAADLAQAEGRPYKDAIARARSALAELRRVGDRRRYAQSMDALLGMINIDYPHEALDLATDAAEVARSLGDDVGYGRAVYRICDVALDLNDVEVFEHWRSELETLHLAALPRAKADLLLATYGILRSGELDGSVATFLRIDDRMRALGESPTVEAPAAAVCAALWQGRVSEARRLLESPMSSGIPLQLQSVFDLIALTLEGPNWPLDSDPEPTGTLTYPMHALIRYLRGERDAGDRLLVARYDDRIAWAGHAYQRFMPFYPASVVTTLGPASTEPDTAWLHQWMVDPPLPGLWTVYRAIAAIVFAEHHPDRRAEFATGALALMARVTPDEGVGRWITERASRLL
jgi:hypothetical protein